MTNKDITVHGTNYEVRVYHNGKTWESYGYIHDIDIDSVWLNAGCETFEGMDGLILAIFREAFA